MFTALTYILVPIALIYMALTFFGLHNSKSVIGRFLVILLMAGGLSISLITFDYLLSRPKHEDYEWYYANIEEVEVAAAHIAYEQAIYLWLIFPNENTPRYYVFDWNDEEAKQLQEAMKQKGKQGSNNRGKVVMKNPFGGASSLGSPNAEDGQSINGGGMSLENRGIEYEFVPLDRQLPPKTYEPENTQQ